MMVVPDVVCDAMAVPDPVTPVVAPRLEIVLANGAQLIASGGVLPATLVNAIKTILAAA